LTHYIMPGLAGSLAASSLSIMNQPSLVWTLNLIPYSISNLIVFWCGHYRCGVW